SGLCIFRSTWADPSLEEKIMKAEKSAICVLIATASLLFLACLFVSKPAAAEVAIREGDSMMTTFPASTGGDDIYIADTRSGMMVVFTYDAGAKSLVPQAVRPIGDAFAR